MFRQRLEKKILDMEKYMESFKESISKRFENQEENFKNIVDKMKSFEVTQREYKKLSSRLEDRGKTDGNEGIELKQVNYLNFSLFFSFFDLFQFLKPFLCFR